MRVGTREALTPARKTIVPLSNLWSNTDDRGALFRPRKGLEILIEALAHLVSQGKQIRLHAIGEFETPEYEAEIMSLVHLHEVERYIEWVGFVDDITVEFSCMDLFILPSLYGEGLPMVVLRR